MKDRRTAIGFGAFVAAIVTAATVTVVAAQPGGAYGSAKTKTYKVTLNGTSEVPPADLDGTGSAVVKLKGKTGLVCVTLKKIANIGPATMAHIHSGVVGVDGPIVFTLVTPALVGKKYQKSKTCGTPAARALRRAAGQPRWLLPERAHRRLPRRRDPRPSSGSAGRATPDA